MSKATGKAQTGATGKAGKADSKGKGKATTDSKADKPAGRAEAEAAALALVGDVKSHTGGRINLDSVRVCPRKGGKVKTFLRPTYETPAGVTLTPYEAGGFTGYVICDLTTEAGRQTLAALIAAKRKPTRAEAKAASKAADKASKADSKPASKGKPAEADKAAGKGKGQAGKPASKPQQADKGTTGKAKASKGKGQAEAGKATA